MNLESPMHPFLRSRCRTIHVVALLGLLAAPGAQATIAVTDTGTGSATTCTLAQAILAANLANNPGNATPAGATTVSPLSESAATGTGIGTCAGAVAGSNTIQLPAGAAIDFSAGTADNYWYGPNALPPIASTIAIEGNGATLRIPFVPATRLRFFFVGADPQSVATPGYNTPGPGSLTVRNLTLDGGVQRGGNSRRGGGGAGLGGAIFNQGKLTLSGVTLINNLAVGGSGATGTGTAGGGMGQDSTSGGGMGGDVPLGTGDAGLPGTLATGVGGNGGGPASGLGGAGSYNNGGTGGIAGNGGGGGGGSGPNSTFYNAGGGGGFGGGAGGEGARAGATSLTGGSFSNGGEEGTGGGGGVGAGGASSGSSLAAGGGGFGGGGGNAFIAGKGGFGGGGGAGAESAGGFGGGAGFANQGAFGGGGAGMGGAIFNHGGSLTLINCTLTANGAIGGASGFGGMPNLEGAGGSALGGAVFNLNGAVNVRFSTFYGNGVTAGSGTLGTGAQAGGAIYSLGYNATAAAGSDSAALLLHNSILAGSNGGFDLVVNRPTMVSGGLSNASATTVTALGVNLVMSALAENGAGALPAFSLSSDPGLTALANNGGPTKTMAPVPGSVVIDAGQAGCAAPPTDQRGYQRVAGAAPDLGAYETDAAEVEVSIFTDGFEGAGACRGR
jgi:hypothetical protein